MRAIAVILLAASISACDGRVDSSPKPPKPSLPAWQEALRGDVHAMADGSAYLVAATGVFYIVDGKIVEVTGIPVSLRRETPKISALADGTALLIYGDSDPPQAFWLKKDAAEPMANADKAPTSSTTSKPEVAGFYFAQVSELRQQLSDTEDCENRDEDYDDREPDRDYDYE